MKASYKIKYYFLWLCFAFFYGKSFSQTTVIDSMDFGGMKRHYRIYIPTIYKSTKAVPLVFDLHGLGSNGMEQEVYGDFRSIADTANFIIVSPNGTSTAYGLSWNNFANPGTGIDDVGFISALLDKVSSKYSINKNRVYSTGMSNGGFISYDLACFLNSRIAAIASVTGSMIASHLKACKVNRPTPVMEIHGTADNTVSYHGNAGILASTDINTLVNFWAKLNNCAAPVLTTLPNINTKDNSTVEHLVFNNGKKGSTVELYRVIGGGHTWPGSPINTGQITNQDFNASKEIWRFFSQFSLDKQTNIDQVTSQLEIMLYPNPANNYVDIQTNQFSNYTIRVYNNMGQQIMETISENGAAHISRGSLASGMYMIQLVYADQTISKKIIFN